MRYLLASILLAVNLFAATPPQSVDLDISQTTRNFSLKWAEGTTPLIRANLRNAGAAYTATGWTGTLYLQSTWDDTQVQAIPSTATGATYLDFQLTGAQTATSGVFFANFIATDGTATVEWQRGQVDVRDSPGTAGAGSVTLTSPLTWSSYTYTGTAAAGPYRAGTNVTFSSSTGGAVAINSADTLGALTPTAGRLIYGNGSAWTVLAPGTVGQVLSMGASLPAWASAGAGDITGVTAGTGLSGGGASGDVTLSLANTAVSAGSYGPATLTVDAQGRLTAASTSSSAAIQSALGNVYLPLAGGTLTGNLAVQNANAAINILTTGSSSAILTMTSTPSAYPSTVGEFYFDDLTDEIQRVRIAGIAPTSTRGKLLIQTANNTGTLQDALTLDYDQSATFAGVITGNGSGLTNLDATDLVGLTPSASLGSGTADSTTYLRGDRTWATVAGGIGGSTGGADNLALRADGTGGAILQSSDLSIEDVSTSTANNLAIKNNHSGQTNSDFVVTPKGTGAFIIGPRPDGTATGGNARGANAVDLQSLRTPYTGANQVASGSGSSILGGARNRVSTSYSVIAGGYANTAIVNDYASVGGGLSNSAGNYAAVVGGGDGNAASGNRSTVGGGYGNTASGANSFVGGGGTGSGGFGNTASGAGSSVVGGSLNTATQSYSSSLGGANNNITATYGAGLGGDNADVSASYAMAGGRETLADQSYGVALGYYADTDHHAGLTLAGGRVAATGDSQTALTPVRVQTTNATPTSLFLDGASVRWTVASGVSYACTVQVVGRSSGGESAAYWFHCLVENNGGTTTLIGGGAASTSFEDNAAWDCAITADDTNDSLQIAVTGAAATTITWSATILSTKAK